MGPPKVAITSAKLDVVFMLFTCITFQLQIFKVLKSLHLSGCVRCGNHNLSPRCSNNYPLCMTLGLATSSNLTPSHNLDPLRLLLPIKKGMMMRFNITLLSMVVLAPLTTVKVRVFATGIPILMLHTCSFFLLCIHLYFIC